ncbi:MAG: hypothetical protein ACK4RK_21880 [Gemmataceae bacterium]
MSRTRNGWMIGTVLLIGGATTWCHAAEHAVSFRLGATNARALPSKHGHAHTGGGNIDVQQPAPDTLVITMTGVAVAGGFPACQSQAGFHFDLSQCFRVVFEKADVHAANLYVQGRVVGLLRNASKGTAQSGEACVTIFCTGPDGPIEIGTLCVAPSSAGCKENVSVYNREGPICLPVGPGCYTLHQTFTLQAAQHKGAIPGHPATAEFAPGSALNPVWITYKDPFHGVNKRDFGFQVILKVVPADVVE